MKNKFMFFLIVGLVILSIFIVNYGQSITTDCIGAVIGLAGGALAVFDTVKNSRRKIALVPLWIGILILIAIGFVQFKGVIILAAFGFAALGLYIFFRLKEWFKKNEKPKGKIKKILPFFIYALLYPLFMLIFPIATVD